MASKNMKRRNAVLNILREHGNLRFDELHRFCGVEHSFELKFSQLQTMIREGSVFRPERGLYAPMLTYDNLSAIESGYYECLRFLTWDCSDYCDLIDAPENGDFEISDSIGETCDERVAQFLDITPHPLVRKYAEQMITQQHHHLNHTFEHCGHDLYLTSHHHGAGFWDRGLGDLGDELTKYAERVSEVHVFYQDGKIYAE